MVKIGFLKNVWFLEYSFNFLLSFLMKLLKDMKGWWCKKDLMLGFVCIKWGEGYIGRCKMGRYIRDVFV